VGFRQSTVAALYEMWSWTRWYRHVTLSLLARAVLAAVRKLAEGPLKKSRGTGRN
jgi:SRSO17 transposase